jgi:hypothetical protein
MVWTSPEPHVAPLCPAGHLPLKGGDRQLRLSSLSCKVGDLPVQGGRPISPLEGEMSGRTEGGVNASPFAGASL